MNADDDHGTNIAMIAAAARDDTGIVGIAFDASILALRADTPGSCSTDTVQDSSLGCSFSNRDIARGIDVAVDAGAAVINLSLGGSAPNREVLDSVARASGAGVVIVVASGNFGDGSDPDFSRFEPTPFAAAVRAAGGDNVIIVGSVDEGGNFSSFSNPAGSQADFFLAARGERLCCAYENGELFVGSDAQGQFVVLFSGTSFAAPQVAGAVALLKQAFPNLTGAEMVEILLESARDGGDPGTDTVYGRGVLDIAQAFRPAGAMSVAGTTQRLSTSEPLGTGSAVMGDALSRAGPLMTIATDKYDRAYGVDLGRGLRDGGAAPDRLTGAIRPGGRRVAAAGKNVALAFTIADASRVSDARATVDELMLSSTQAEGARVLAGRIAARIAPDLAIGFATRESAGGLVAQLQGSKEPAFLIAGNGERASFIEGRPHAGFAARWSLGPNAGLSLALENGAVDLRRDPLAIAASGMQDSELPYQRIGLRADRSWERVEMSLAFDWLVERNTILGAWFADTLTTGGSTSAFVSGKISASPATGWTLTAGLQRGWTRPEKAGLIGHGPSIASQSWSIDLDRRGVFGSEDRFALRLAQPLRVESGGLSFRLPVSYDYASESTQFGNYLLGLAPSGREITGEARWTGPLGAGWGGASLFYRKDPGHRADSPPDAGVAVNYSVDF